MPAPKSLRVKLDAALAYLISGFDSEKAASMLGKSVASRTIREWTETDWWPDMIAKAKIEKQAELDASMTHVIHKAMDQVNERLDKGDPFIRKTPKLKKDENGGTYSIDEIGFKPIGGKDATMIVAILSDKRALIRGEPTRRTEMIKEKDRLKDVLEDMKKPVVEDKAPKELH